MNPQLGSRSRILALGAAAALGALTLTACGSDNNSPTAAASTAATAAATAAASSTAGACGSGTVLGSGSTAQQNAMTIWAKDFQQQCPGANVNYQGVGSSAGRTTFLAGKVAFAGSDAAMAADEIAKSGSVCTGGGRAINLPMAGGPIAIGYNVPGVSNLVLNADLLAKIFTGKITKWNDPAIKALNAGASLPDLAIQTFHRSDGSGTSANFTAYLKASAAASWTYGTNSTWPAPGGQGATGSSGLAAQVKAVKGAISYFELSFAKSGNITTAAIDTGSGTPVAVSTDAAAKALANAQVIGTGSNLALQLDYADKTPGDYPISLVTYEIACDKGNNPATLPALKAFLTYTASDAGQQAITSAGYMQLPSAITDKLKTVIATLS
ncbi:phosphate ABC transporter substrate-binding protein PstS [Streptacidiphilus carbonis]|uniref:phosphate ABC transporter substrate-binding protein PstS n=1 Tax=Streptacidiphilus carbonis TaxID=105422 RepID=UPI0005A6CBC1|nr:phosphate ABC transporter substrate-binding protein PstS [Streptacidiphilus carbonis]